MKMLKKVVSLIISVCFIFNTLLSNYCFAAATPLALPAAGQLLPLSKPLPYTVLRGIRLNPNDPMKFEFVIDKPKDKAVDTEEFRRLVSYFMAALTIPEQDFWVNLSPYEQDRVIPTTVADTDFGRDLLIQDYVLKQVAASITYPETALGKTYWNKVYAQAAKAGLSRNQAINSFSKVWIVPENVEVFEDGNLALVGNAKLKVLSESDYKALSHNGVAENSAAAKIMKEMVIPALTKEVNTGSNFTQLRQMFHSFALALWFKNKLKDSFFKYYINQNKTKGIDLNDKTIKDKIYNQYVAAFKTGVYNMIKKEFVGANNHSSLSKITKRQYFSGGAQMLGTEGTPGNLGPAYDLKPARNTEGRLSDEAIAALNAVADTVETVDQHAQMILDFFAQSNDPIIRDNAKVLTPVVLAEMYRVHILPNKTKTKETFEPLIKMIENEGVSERIAIHIVRKLASEKVHLLGVRNVALVLGLVALSCNGAIGSKGGTSDASAITAPAVTPDAGVVPTSDVIPSQGGQADTANPVDGTPSTITLGYGTAAQGGFVIENFGDGYANSDPQNPNSISISASLTGSSDWGNAVIQFNNPRDISGYTLKVTVVSTNGMQGLNVYDIPAGVDPGSISAHRDAVTITGFKAGAVYEIPLDNATDTWRIVFETSPTYGTGNPVGSSSAVLTVELVPNGAVTNGSGMTTINTTKERARIEAELHAKEAKWKEQFRVEQRRLTPEKVTIIDEAGKQYAMVVRVMRVADMPAGGKAYRFSDRGMGVVVLPLDSQIQQEIDEAGAQNVTLEGVKRDRKIAEAGEMYFEGHQPDQGPELSEEDAHTVAWHGVAMVNIAANNGLGDEHRLQQAQLAQDPTRKGAVAEENRQDKDALITRVFKGQDGKILPAADAVLAGLNKHYGGVNLAKTKITQHVLGAAVKLNVSEKVVNELKNAKSVGFEILSLGDRFVLR